MKPKFRTPSEQPDIHKTCIALNKLIQEKKNQVPIRITQDEIAEKIKEMKL